MGLIQVKVRSECDLVNVYVVYIDIKSLYTVTRCFCDIDMGSNEGRIELAKVLGEY